MFVRFKHASALNLGRLFFSTCRTGSTLSKFDNASLHGYTAKALKKVLGYKEMTLIQQSILQQPNTNLCLRVEKNTGKTIGYLIKAIEATHANDLVVVVSPGHESGSYVDKQVRKLIQFHKRQVHFFSSAESLVKQIEQMQRRQLHFVIVTPSRLEELLRIPSFQQDCEKRLKLLVLDEAEQLNNSLMTVSLNRLPPCPTWVFASQCVPTPRIPNPLWLDPLRVVRQRIMMASYQKQWLLILETLRQTHSGHVVVYVPTPHLYIALYRQLMKRPLSDTKLSSYNGVLFTDRPSDLHDADLIIQVGSPGSRAVYLDRLSRAKQSVLILAPFEKHFLSELADQPTEKNYIYS
ncbi:P-loop containing nucleoside triphosphate hydrolase protein [Sporodiniella umbellata]|nr:P-loop containing nucleoside triphosphate hydrolase protein [Sporodiniella umbellata]